jgi:hypothetical protein
MASRRSASVLSSFIVVALAACGGATSPPSTGKSNGVASASSSTITTTTTATTNGTVSTVSTNDGDLAPHAPPSTTVLATPGSLQAPTFTLPKPQPPVNEVINLGSNPPTPAKLEMIFSAKKPGTDEHAAAGRRLAELCRRYELSTRASAGDALAKNNGNPGDATAKKAFLDARKEYEVMRHCVLDAYRKVSDLDHDYAKGDEVLHALASEYEDRRVFVAIEDGPLVEVDRQKALSASLELVKRYPKSRFVAAAYLRFAEHYFDDAMQGKADWKIPQEAYGKVRDLTDPATDIENAYAHYRLGYVAWNQGDLAAAKKSFRAAVDVTTKSPKLAHAAGILAAANDALATVP